jgi:hypothetical protein
MVFSFVYCFCCFSILAFVSLFIRCFTLLVETLTCGVLSLVLFILCWLLVCFSDPSFSGVGMLVVIPARVPEGLLPEPLALLLSAILCSCFGSLDGPV